MENLDFTHLALISAGLTALICSFLGVFVVLRKLSFIGIALAQLATCGIALSGFIHTPCNIGAAIMIFLGVGVFAHEPSKKGLPSEALVGSLYAGAGAMAVLLTAISPHGDADMLSLLFGNILSVTPEDIKTMIIVFSLVLLFCLVFFKELLLVSFDPFMAQTLGYKTKLWNYLFFISLGLTIAVAIHAAGILLVFSLLVLPALTGLCLSKGMLGVFITSEISALCAVGLGVWSSLIYDLPTGAAISAVSCILFVLAFLLGKIIKNH